MKYYGPVDIVICIVAIACALFFVLVGVSCDISEKDGNCAYCHGTITEDADYVCMTDGRRMHTGCYMRAIREDGNG